MKPGDAVFFKQARTSTRRNGQEVKFKGYGFGVMLGHVPPFAGDPPIAHLFRMMGGIGFVSFDDIAKFIGDEMAQKCVEAFKDKYYGNVVVPEKPIEEAQIEVESEVVEPSKIVGVNGSPLIFEQSEPKELG
jgi:hypothetical protein